MRIDRTAIARLAATSREIAETSQAAAATFERLANDPALTALAANPEIDWLSDDHVADIAKLGAAAEKYLRSVDDFARAARKAGRPRRSFQNPFRKG